MRRWSFITALALSALLLAPTTTVWISCELTGEHAIAWGRSPQQMITLDAHYIRYSSGGTIAAADIDAAIKRFNTDNGIHLNRSDFSLHQSAAWGSYYSGYEDEEYTSWLKYDIALIAGGDSPPIPLGATRTLTLALWWPLVISLISPLAALMMLLRRSLLPAKSACRSCGCDLSNIGRYVCPECGSVRMGRAVFTGLCVFSIYQSNYTSSVNFSRWA